MDLEAVEEDIKEEAAEVVSNKEVAIMIITEEEVETMITEITTQETKVMIITGKKFKIMITNTNKNIKKRGKFSTYQRGRLNLSTSQNNKRMMLHTKIKMIRQNRGKREDTLIQEEVAEEEAEVETDLLNTMRAKIMSRVLIKRSHTMIARDNQREIIINQIKVIGRKISSKSLTDKFLIRIRNIKLQRSKVISSNKRSQPRRSQKQPPSNQLLLRKSNQRSKAVTDSQSLRNEHYVNSLFINTYIFYLAFAIRY
jgi:hypothetical protein